MNITENENGRIITIARLTSEQAVTQLNHLLSGYGTINQLYLARITMTRAVRRALAKVLSLPERNWLSLKLVDCLMEIDSEWIELERSLNIQCLVLQTTSRFRATDCCFPILASISKVKSLRLCSGSISEDMAKELEKGLYNTTTLEELSFSGSRRLFAQASVLESLARGLKKNMSLRSLSLGDIQAQDQDISRLLTFLRHINLHQLDLSNNLIADKTIRTLARVVLPNCPNLQVLDLSLQRYRPNMKILAPALAQSKLRQLILSNSQLEDEDVVALVDTLLQPTAALTDLNLENNRRVTGASLLYFAENLPRIKCLRHLNIRKMTDYKSQKVLKAIAKNMEKNTHLLLLRTNYFLCVEQTREIQYLVNANRGGRRALEEGIPITSWPKLLERANSITYYCPLNQNAPADAIYTLIRNSPGLWKESSN